MAPSNQRFKQKYKTFVLDSQVTIPDFEFRISDFGFPISDSEFWIQHAACADVGDASRVV